MPFQKGNKLGGRRRKEQIAYAALIMSLKQDGEDMPKLREIMDRLVTAAVDGERWAIREIFDRLDGKPALAIEAEVEIDPVIQRVQDMSDEEVRGRLAALHKLRADKEPEASQPTRQSDWNGDGCNSKIINSK